MTRIISGRYGGRRLVVPQGSATRPTSDRVREALFSRLEHEVGLSGARVLDLFAGSGALGLEAASRGADTVLLVESGKSAAAAITRNIDHLGIPGVRLQVAPVASVLASPRAGARVGEPFDAALLDPPYDFGEEQLADVLGLLVAEEWLTQGAVVVVERSSRSPEPRWPHRMSRFDERRYGETTLWWAETMVVGGVA